MDHAAPHKSRQDPSLYFSGDGRSTPLSETRMRVFLLSTLCIAPMTLLFHVASCFSTRSIATSVTASRATLATTLRRFSAASSSSLDRQEAAKNSSKAKKSGGIDFYDEQEVLKVDQDRLCRTITDIRRLIGYDTYSVTLILVDDDEMQSINKESRGIDAPTDILSFPFHAAIEPGVLEPVTFDIPDYYMLGDLIVDVPYVIRRCQEDQAALEDGYGTEDDEDEEDRGVSGAMAKVFDPETRINMLLVHGLLHLVGYDHEENDEYEVMVAKEEEILRELGMPLP
eukprot:scaffold38719_cov176-Amphora_coffeaeformis.AAC.2